MPKVIGELKLYTVEDLADILEVQERTIRNYLKDGLLKGRKLARRWYVTEENLREYFEQPEPAQIESIPITVESEQNMGNRTTMDSDKRL